MKKINTLLILILVTSILMSACTTNINKNDVEPIKTKIEDSLFGAIGSFEVETLSILQMLTFAIQDEYLARSEYYYIINEMNGGNPFINIVKAEETHVSMLIPLFEAYGFSIPEDTSEDHLIIPNSITEALKTGVQAEIDNIAMYETFLTYELPDDIRAAFESLMKASKSHLNAFNQKLN